MSARRQFMHARKQRSGRGFHPRHHGQDGQLVAGIFGGEPPLEKQRRPLPDIGQIKEGLHAAIGLRAFELFFQPGQQPIELVARAAAHVLDG